MRYRRFGKTDWQVSEIGMGGSWFYGRPEMGLQPVSHGVSVVERAFDKGINYFDTAPLYGKGRSEEVLGHALKGVTEPYYLATKVGYYPEPFDYTRDAVMRGFEASLKRLQRDHVDLIQIHESEKAGWEGVFGAGRTLDTLRQLRDQGMATHIGLTGSDLELMVRILREADDIVSVITFLKYDLVTQAAKQVLVPAADELDVAVILASPLHGGLLGSKRDQWRETGKYGDAFEKQERVEKVLEKYGLESVDTGLRYLLSDARVSTILSGVDSVEEVDRSVAVADGRVLSDVLIEELQAA